MARSTAQKVVTHGTHRDATKDFLTHARDIASREGWSETEVFTRWCTAAACSLLNPVWQQAGDKTRWDANEERYMRVVAQCRKGGETMVDMAKMLGITAMALQDSPRDFLGPVFMELCASNLHGQFFTPDEISELLARINLGDAKGMLTQLYIQEGRSWLELAEPACGVAGMVLASNRVLEEQGIDIGTQARWSCVDIDRRAVDGAFIQTALTGANAIIVHGNALTLEEWDVLPTPQALKNREYESGFDVKLIARRGLSDRVGEEALAGAEAKEG